MDTVSFYFNQLEGVTYLWDVNGDGEVDYQGEELFKIQHIYSGKGTYKVNLQLSLTSCKTTVRTKVTVKSVSQARFDFLQECERVDLTNYSQGYDSLLWLLSDGSLYKSFNPSHSFRKEGIYEISLHTFKNGCEQQLTKEVAFAPISSKANVRTTNECIPATIEMNLSKDCTDSIQWYINNDLVGSGSKFKKSVKEAGEYKVKATLINEYGCSEIQHFKPFKIDESLKSGFELSSAVECVGSDFSALDTSYLIDERKWLWGDGNSTEGAKNPSHTYETSGSFNVSLIVKRGSCVDTVVKEDAVRVDAFPEAALDLSADMGCVPFDVEVTSNHSGDYNYEYIVVDGIDTLNKDENAIHFKESGVHQILIELINAEAKCGISRSYKVRAYDPFTELDKPQIADVSIDQENLFLSWNQLENVAEYQVFQKLSTGDLRFIGSTTDTFYRKGDRTIDSNEQRFVVQAIDKCGNASGLSKEAHNIVLNGYFAVDSIPALEWNSYRSWTSGVAYYEIQHDIGYGWESVAKTSIPRYLDELFDDGKSHEVSYRIIAHGNNGEVSAASNTWEFKFKPNIFIPTAFSPNFDQLNDQYEIKGHGFERADIKIYNSYGQQVFNSNGELMPWDGTHEGRQVETGTYVCVVDVETPNGRRYHFQQTVTLVR